MGLDHVAGLVVWRDASLVQFPARFLLTIGMFRRQSDENPKVL